MRRFRFHVLALCGIVLFGMLPLIPVLVAALVADFNGCRLDEGSVHSCIVLGHDIGGALYAMGVFGWFGLATIPIAALLLIPWAIWLSLTLFGTVKTAKQ